jgi:hypothetical protein
VDEQAGSGFLVWVLEFSVKGRDEPVYPMMGAVVFSSRERALAYIAERGVRVRWEHSRNPHYQHGFTRGSDVFWKWVLSRQEVDYFDD